MKRYLSSVFGNVNNNKTHFFSCQIVIALIICGEKGGRNRQHISNWVLTSVMFYEQEAGKMIGL